MNVFLCFSDLGLTSFLVTYQISGVTGSCQPSDAKNSLLVRDSGRVVKFHLHVHKVNNNVCFMILQVSITHKHLVDTLCLVFHKTSFQFQY